MEQKIDKYGGPERRRYPRLPGAFVEYIPEGKISSRKTSFTENISPAGICILVDEDVKRNTGLSLKIYLPGSKESIEAEGRVVWSKPSSFLTSEKRKHYDLGVEIIKIEENDRQRIWEYIVKNIDKDKDFKGF